jgi:hypothetical protein
VTTVSGSESEVSAPDSTAVDEESTSVTMAVESSAGVEVPSTSDSDVVVSSESEVEVASSADIPSGSGAKVEVRSSTLVDSGSSSSREVDQVSLVGPSDKNVLETSEGNSGSDPDTELCSSLPEAIVLPALDASVASAVALAWVPSLVTVTSSSTGSEVTGSSPDCTVVSLSGLDVDVLSVFETTSGSGVVIDSETDSASVDSASAEDVTSAEVKESTDGVSPETSDVIVKSSSPVMLKSPTLEVCIVSLGSSGSAVVTASVVEGESASSSDVDSVMELESSNDDEMFDPSGAGVDRIGEDGSSGSEAGTILVSSTTELSSSEEFGLVAMTDMIDVSSSSSDVENDAVLREFVVDSVSVVSGVIVASSDTSALPLSELDTLTPASVVPSSDSEAGTVVSGVMSVGIEVTSSSSAVTDVANSSLAEDSVDRSLDPTASVDDSLSLVSIAKGVSDVTDGKTTLSVLLSTSLASLLEASTVVICSAIDVSEVETSVVGSSDTEDPVELSSEAASSDTEVSVT